MNLWPMWVWWTVAGASALCGLPLLWWALFRDRSRGRRRCPKCWYDMSGVVQAGGQWTCPECGALINRERRLHKTRRRWKWAAVGLALAVLGTTGAVRQQVLREGWLSFLPTWALIETARLPWFHNDSRILKELTYDRLRMLKAGNGQSRAITDLCMSFFRDARDGRARRSAISHLAWIGGRDERITPFLIAAIDSTESDVRVQAIRSFGIYLADPNQVIPVLMKIAADSMQPAEVRSEAIGVLSRYGRRAAGAAPTLAAVLSDSNADVASSTLLTIGRIDPTSLRAALPTIEARFRSPPGTGATSSEHASWAVPLDALSTIKGLPADLAPKLSSMLPQCSIDDQQVPILWALCRMGPAAASARSDLQAILKNTASSTESLLLAQIALDRMDDATLNPALELAKVIRTPGSVQRLEAARLLWRGPGNISAAIPLLIEETDDGLDPMVMTYICHALERHAPATPEVLDAIDRLYERWPDDTVSYTIGQMRRREWRGESGK